MGFIKHAYVQSIGTATFLEEGLRKTASSESLTLPKSYYIDGSRKIDVRGMLKEASSKFAISDRPEDYLFEAIRANTVNVPNDNHDGFHRNELLRFDTRLAMPVYMTYQGKPHHMNHKANDPKRARGVILDAHYNDEAPALESCYRCNFRTAEENGRDPSGIHCTKCASVVKDDFIEILVAVDTKKDKRLAEAIRAGQLNAGSMGCNCASTICNVCQHVARSTSEFCEHIRGGSKGSLWAKHGSKFQRIQPDQVRAVLRSAGYNPSSPDNQIVSVSLVVPEREFEVRKAFEYCQGVEFDEYSRVHRPADPKARTVEILKAASTELTIEEETEQLLRRAEMETTMSKAASQGSRVFHVVRVNGDDEHLNVQESFDSLKKTIRVNADDKLEYAQVEADSLGQAIVRATKSAQYLPMTSDVNLVVPDGVQVHLDQNGQMGMDQNQMPGQVPGQGPGGQAVQPQGPKSIEDVTQQEMSPKAPQQQSPEEFGMLPPGGSAENLDESLNTHAEGDEVGESEENMENEQKYAAVYGDFQVDVFADHATLLSPSENEVLTIQMKENLASNEDRYKFGGSIIESVLTDGLVRTALKFEGKFNEKIADSVEGAMWDFQGGRPHSDGGALEGHMEPQKEKRQEGTDVPVIPGATKDYDDDMKDTRPMPANSIESRDTDMADEATVASPKQDSVEGHEEPQREKRPSYSQTDDALSGATTDMEANAGGDSSPKIAEKTEKTADAKTVEDRVKKLYAARLEKVKADFEAEKKALEKSMADRFARALRIASKRGHLNIEVSPLKAKMIDSLTVSRPIGRSASTGQALEYTGLEDGLALHLVEAAWAESAKEEIESLITRAAELMAYDDKYLISAEKDLSKQAAIIPQVVSEDQLEPVNEVQRRSASLRDAATNGNLTLSPRETDLGVGNEDKVSAIRAALSPTRVGRLNDEFRASALA